MPVHGPRRIVGIAPQHLVPEIAQQRLHTVERTLLCAPDAGDHRRGKLGAQRDSQPAGFAGSCFDEPATRSFARVGGIKEEGGVFHGAGQRTVDTETVPGVLALPEGDPAALRLEPVEPAPPGRDADRPGTVGAQRERRQSGGHGRATAAAAAARGVRQVPRVVGGAEGHRLGERPQHHLRHGGFAEDHRTGLAQPPHHFGVSGRLEVVGAAAVAGEFSGDVAVVLDGDRHPQQGESLAGVESFLRGRGLAPRTGRQHDPVRPQLPVQPGDPVEIEVQKRRRGNRARGEHAGLLGRAGEGDIGGVHLAQRSR